MNKRMSDEIFHLYEGNLVIVYARTDKFTEQDVEDYIHDELEIDNFKGKVKKQFVRVNVEGPGGDYPYYIVDAYKRGPGVWETWISEVKCPT